MQHHRIIAADSCRAADCHCAGCCSQPAPGFQLAAFFAAIDRNALDRTHRRCVVVSPAPTIATYVCCQWRRRLCFTILLLIIALVAIAGQWLLSYLSLDWHNSIWIVAQHIAVGGILAGLVLRYFYLQQQLYVQQQLQMQATMQARFQSLQSRIRPHFLFNSMNIIASLIDSDPETAERVVEDMSALFRASLSDEEDLVPLAQEISLCERYINIEQLRLGERLHVNWQKNLHNDQHIVPSLCLQPLIENAIYHGIQPLVTRRHN